MWLLTYRRGCTVVALAATLIAAVALRRAGAQDPQERFTHGQTIAPAYEGFEENPDGTFNLVFGYLNRNYEEVLDIPIGPANSIEPGGPDQGQPTHFYPRRNPFLFSIRVPADFGSKELIWTLTANGKTEKAYASLKNDYQIDPQVIST